MNPLLHLLMVEEHERRLRRAERRSAWAPTGDAPPEPVTLRVDTVWDDPALARLATLAGRRRAPHGRHVVAVVDGRVVAALPLSGGKPYADPFRRTAHLLPLLELRAEQIAGLKPRRRRRGLRTARAGRVTRP